MPKRQDEEEDLWGGIKTAIGNAKDSVVEALDPSVEAMNRDIAKEHAARQAQGMPGSMLDYEKANLSQDELRRRVQKGARGN